MSQPHDDAKRSRAFASLLNPYEVTIRSTSFLYARIAIVGIEFALGGISHEPHHFYDRRDPLCHPSNFALALKETKL
jgi:hypothetical protein